MDTRFKKGQPAWNKKEPIEKLCICGKSFYVKPSMDRLKSCSLECGTKARKGKSLFEGKKHTEATKKKMALAKLGNGGVNHWNHIKDRTKLKMDSVHAYDYRYKDWMRTVKNRDYWKCRMGNEDCSGRLEAHHILPWSQHQELRYEVNNGIALCRYHHPRKREEEKRLAPVFQQMVVSPAYALANNILT